ncbi:MAG TPA: ACP S-malonyltransferase [Chitinivibrionales bacterium]|nr:ACP S-malonyltransferase [Chitinivibrionales bacterium]
MIVFLFPGQGSQEIGMGQDLFKADARFRSLVSLARDLTHEDLEKLCLRGPEKKLRKAQFLQPLLAAVSLGYLRHVREKGITPDAVLGHSLGEITSLAASGVVSDQEAVTIAAMRGGFMDEAAARANGGMMAVLFTPLETVEQLLADMNAPDKIVLANDNAPDQIVVSGDLETMQAFSRRLSELGVGKTKTVLVSGPWHSPYMREAMERFADWVKSITFKPPSVPLLLNGTGAFESDPVKIKELVTLQLTRPVLWRASMQTLLAKNADVFLEIGPQRVLSGLVRVNGFPKRTTVFNINNLTGLERAARELVPGR